MPCSDTSSPAVSTCSSTRIPKPLHRPEAAEGRREGERADGEEPEELHADLVEGAGVDESARPVARFRQRGTAKRPVATVPQTPASPWTATAPIGSSIPSRSTSGTATTAIGGGDESDQRGCPRRDEPRSGGDRDERRDTPFSIIETSGFFRTTHAVQDPAERARGGREVRRQRDVGEVAECRRSRRRASSPG